MNVQKQPPEAFCKKMFLEIPQNSQENTCARDFIKIETLGSGLQLY